MKDVVQKTLEPGVETKFEMKLERSQFLVKNFTDGPIEVKLGINTTHSVIGPMAWERVFNNVDNLRTSIAEVTNEVKVTAAKAGMVEVASID